MPVPASIDLLPKVARHAIPAARKLALMGGAYGNLPALQACLEHARLARCDAFAFLGDITGCCGHSDETINLVRGNFSIFVAGNHEQQSFVAQEDCACNYADAEDGACSGRGHAFSLRTLGEVNRAWLGTLPEIAVVETAIGPLLLHHGSPAQTNEFLYESELDEERLTAWLFRSGATGMVGTHTGLPWIRRLPGGPFAMNCGVVGKPDHDGDRAVHYSTIDLNPRSPVEQAARIERVEYDHETWARQLAAEGVEDLFIQPLVTGVWTVGVASLPATEQQKRALIQRAC